MDCFLTALAVALIILLICGFAACQALKKKERLTAHSPALQACWHQCDVVREREGMKDYHGDHMMACRIACSKRLEPKKWCLKHCLDAQGGLGSKMRKQICVWGCR